MGKASSTCCSSTASFLAWLCFGRSALNNAGFGLLGDNLTQFREDPLINIGAVVGVVGVVVGVVVACRLSALMLWC